VGGPGLNSEWAAASSWMSEGARPAAMGRMRGIEDECTGKGSQEWLVMGKGESAG
jgi:hypothetical protein